MQHIDWLIYPYKGHAPEEDLDRPYAFYRRIYTRREFENLHDRCYDNFDKAADKANEIAAADRRLFFEKLDFITGKREIIYENEALATAPLIGFSHHWRFPFVGYMGFSFPVCVILKIWEEDRWRPVCPNCGAKSYQYDVVCPYSYCYCPECGKFFRQWGELRDKGAAEAAMRKFFPKHEEKKPTSAHVCIDSKHTLTFTSGGKNRRKKEPPKLGFREISARWRKEYDEVPREEVAEQARFAVAKQYGADIKGFLYSIKETDAFLKADFKSPVTRFLEQLENGDYEAKLTDGEAQLEKTYKFMQRYRG